MQQVAERLRHQPMLADRNLLAIDPGHLDVPGGLAVAARAPLEQLERRGGALAERRVRGGIERIAEQQTINVRGGARPAQRSMVKFKPVIKHGSTSCSAWCSR